MNKKTKLYLLIAFSWTWCGWIAAYLISNLNGSVLSTDTTIFSLWTIYWQSDSFFSQLLFALAVYGPFIGFIATGGFRKQTNNVGSKKQFWHYILLIPLLSVIPCIILSMVTSFYDTKGLAFTTIFITVLVYFISNLLTSGTEEFGWRGILYPEMKSRGMSFWDISWKGGIIWALWHYPLMFILYLPVGLKVLLPSLLGFTASIVAMNYITNFIYEKTKKIWLVAVLHALNNTMNFVVTLLFPGTPFTILTNLMSWAVVWWIDKKYGHVIFED